MAKDDWTEKDWVTKDNLFHRRVSDVRNRYGANMNEAEALELVQSARLAGANLHAFSQEAKTNPDLSDDDIDRRRFFDHFTPVYNFRYMLRSFRRELTRAHRYKRPVSICIVIVDGLTAVLEQFGHLALEQAIMATAETLIRSTRSDVDMVGRYGEDRFMVILPETPGTGAAVLAERLRKKFDNLNLKHQWHTLRLSASIGISYYPGHGGHVEELIAQADLAAETVQERGGNGVCYAPENPEIVA